MPKIEPFLKKHELSVGDRVRVETAKGSVVGTVIPSTRGFLDLKLSSGYNAGIEIKKIKSVKKLGREKSIGKPVAKKIEQDSSLPIVSIVHTGGTVASRVNYKTGGVIAGFDAEDIISMYPELSSIASIKSVFVENIMSEDITFRHYQKIAHAIKKEVERGVTGIIVTHGTDTLHYTAAALSFAFEKLPVPVILVGSQRSSDRPSSDAGMNLICASRFIAQSDFAGVALCMHSTSSDSKCTILPGTRARKMHSSRRDAFKPINSRPIAEVDYASGKITFTTTDYPRKPPSKECVLKDKFEPRVGIIKARPNMFPEEFDFYRKAGFKGLILEATGIGHMPINTRENAGNKKALKKLIDSGCVVCVTTQCIYGRVHETIYTNTRNLKSLGTIFLHDMTSETAFIKLAWLLGNFDKKKAAELMPENLRGEISERRLAGEFEPQP